MSYWFMDSDRSRPCTKKADSKGEPLAGWGDKRDPAVGRGDRDLVDCGPGGATAGNGNHSYDAHESDR
jgi:hypothetical protein